MVSILIPLGCDFISLTRKTTAMVLLLYRVDHPLIVYTLTYYSVEPTHIGSNILYNILVQCTQS